MTEAETETRTAHLRPALMLLLASLAAVLVVLVLMVEAAVRTEAAFAPARAHGARLAELTSLRGELARLGGQENDMGRRQALALRLARLAEAGWSADSARALSRAAERVAAGDGREGDLASTDALLRAVLLAELPRQAEQVAAAGDSASSQLEVSVALAGVALAVLLFGVVYFHRRLLVPLRNLMYLMELMGRQDYTSAITTRVDPLLKPLFDHYNAMVEGTLAVEARHRRREAGLEREVSQASRALLQQQAALARSERMAAIGEVAARIAHGMRNPLGGVQLALQNLERDLPDRELAERLAASRDELGRATELLDELVAFARPRPEPAVTVRLADSLGELVRLLRHQLRERVSLALDVPDELTCRLAEGSLRQMVLELVLNAEHALGERHGTIRVTVRGVNGGLELVVEDDGPGFPQPLLEQGIADFVSLERGGRGLGLVAVRRLVHGSGGRIALANRPAGGARVTLYLPCGHLHG